MRKVIKTQNKSVKAWRLGDGSGMENSLIQQGKIVLRPDGSYEVFSREATGGVGEIACKGDYFKVDSARLPYPNTKEAFEETHKHISGDTYEQLVQPMDAWVCGDPISDEIAFLQREKGLEFHPESPAFYFEAPLWGTVLTAAEDAVLVFYGITRDENGHILDADFNFVAREEFEKTYRFVEC